VTAADRGKFDKLRARYVAVRVKWDEFDSALSRKYGSGFQGSWLKAGERKAKERLGAAMDKAGDAVFEYVQAISPRDWSTGVPAYWVRESLTFEDAVRPVDEPLSVTPPLSYGSTSPKT